MHWVLFDTAIGTCGLAWSNAGVRRLQLPEPDRNATERRLIAGTGATRPERVPEEIADAIGLLQQYFEGNAADLGDVALDLDRTSPFHRRIYAATRTIGWGRTASYGDLARQVGSPGAARAVGQAMARNPVPIIVPCHRVLASGGKVGGFSAYGGVVTKERLLALEGVGPASSAPRLPL
jgi:methylated-DNA-[protein]-cysteine S-methyltransferase